MRILAVDTTSPWGSVALLEKGCLISEAGLGASLTHSERLLPAFEFLLNLRRLDIKDIDGFALAAGPGSFTGIRIGMSTVKSLAYASGKPIAAVSSLEALAYKLRRPGKSLICPLIDAKKGEVYGGLFESRRDDLDEVINQGVYSPDRLFSLLPARRVIHFIGSGAAVYRRKIDEYFSDKARISERSLFIAAEVGRLGWEQLRSGKGRSLLKVEPLYFRSSQAEENRRKS